MNSLPQIYASARTKVLCKIFPFLKYGVQVGEERLEIKRQMARELPDSELEDLAKKFKDYLTEEQGYKTYRFSIGDNFFDELSSVSAATQVLAERYSTDYVARLNGLRAPKTFGEKVNYFFTGKVPQVE